MDLPTITVLLYLFSPSDLVALLKYAAISYELHYQHQPVDVHRRVWQPRHHDAGGVWDYTVERLLNYSDTEEQFTSCMSVVMRIVTCKRLKEATLVLKAAFALLQRVFL